MGLASLLGLDGQTACLGVGTLKGISLLCLDYSEVFLQEQSLVFQNPSILDQTWLDDLPKRSIKTQTSPIQVSTWWEGQGTQVTAGSEEGATAGAYEFCGVQGRK